MGPPIAQSFNIPAWSEYLHENIILAEISFPPLLMHFVELSYYMIFVI